MHNLCTFWHIQLFSCIVCLFICFIIFSIVFCVYPFYLELFCYVLGYFTFKLNWWEANQLYCVLFCVSTFGSFLFLHSFARMAPTKHAATKKPSFKRARINSDHFKFADANMKYNDCYKEVTIIMEMVVHLESLEGTFIPEVFKERTWTKLLNPVEVVYSENV